MVRDDSLTSATPSAAARRAPSTSIPPGIVCAEDYAGAATGCLDPATYAHVAGGAAHDVTVEANRRAYEAWDLWPRVLRDVTVGHTRLRLADRDLAHPILLAPLAQQRAWHPDAELATARGAAASDSVLVLSTLSSVPLEAVARVAGPVRWFQLYLQAQREVTRDLVARAAAAGYAALVVTVDAPVQAASHRALRAGYRAPIDAVAANLDGYPSPARGAADAGWRASLADAMRVAPTWEELRALIRDGPLPVWVKGVAHPDDARRLVDLGVAGLVVSNHGGRGLDGAPASLAVLPRVRSAVPRPFPLLFDGGIRRGSDVFKALALGADAVLVGRLQAYALAVAGALGVAHMVRLLREELAICMALTGCSDLSAITADTLIPSSAPAIASLPVPLA
ncbi:MAG: alpha-hydroxy-acid oxidizing protein [Burkholderiales bacterium]|nr:alpha-hydroxy-acid oxidizing protein [Burkholderiales bacterium]